MAASKKTGGLAGVVAGSTTIATVGKEGVGLTYRGYDIEDLADNATFEEVAYLLLVGELPKASQDDPKMFVYLLIFQRCHSILNSDRS